MHNHPYHPSAHHPGPVRHQGLVGLFGGMIDIATQSIYGGASIVRRFVDHALWGGPEMPCRRCHPPEQHLYHYSCTPHRFYDEHHHHHR